MRDHTYQILNDIYAERLRQEAAEGFTPEQEDLHDFGEMARAAAAYALAACAYSIPAGNVMRDICRDRASKIFPTAVFGEMANCPPREGLIRACVLLMADIARIDRRDGWQSKLDRTDASSRRFARVRDAAASADSPAARLTGQEATIGLGGPAPAGEPPPDRVLP